MGKQAVNIFELDVPKLLDMLWQLQSLMKNSNTKMKMISKISLLISEECKKNVRK